MDKESSDFLRNLGMDRTTETAIMEARRIASIVLSFHVELAASDEMEMSEILRLDCHLISRLTRHQSEIDRGIG